MKIRFEISNEEDLYNPDFVAKILHKNKPKQSKKQIYKIKKKKNY